MYTMVNFKTKKQLKEAVAAGKRERIYQPGNIFYAAEAEPDYTGIAYVEGPHFPASHTWYATVQLLNGVIVKVK